MTFHCSWDTTVTIVTFIVTAILLITAIVFFRKLLYYKKARKKILPFLFSLLVILFCIGFFIGSMLFVPQNISVKNDCIYVERIYKDVIIPVNQIKEIRLCNAADTKNGIRVFASGGFGGYWGKFKSPQLGDYQMYATDSSKKILIKTINQTFILSCDKPNEMINYINGLETLEN